MKNYEAWQPESGPMRSFARSREEAARSSDIISTLISIYGSKELFINEYRCEVKRKKSHPTD